MKTQISEVRFDQLPGNLLNSVKANISDKETVLFCLLIKDPDVAIVVTDYHLVIVSLKGSPFDFNAAMEYSFERHDNYYFKKGWVLTPSLGSIGDISAYEDAPLFGKPGWKVSFDLGYVSLNTSKVEPLKLVVGDEALAKQFVAILKKAKNDAFVRERTPSVQATATADIGDQLAKLAGLLEKGHLTQPEFDAAKKKLLGL